MAQKRYVYRTMVAWDRGVRGVCTAADRPDLPVAPPAEFGGPGDAWSPEDLLVASLNACTLATFLQYAERAKVDLIRYESAAEGVLEFTADGPAFTSFTVRPSVTVATGHLGAAREAMARAERCLVSASLAGEGRLEADIAEASV